eukprot:CAMPEP_0169338818 /NCGR_PEP_ID=MMETSP1017-20121227/18121_1 /TAXON_ID=342587 /ORGANISM="Karlodinium micrum, Strain CCMP2283" /LENGTH=1049 /DNA_ID=CAMNT_0009434383 /DNA_START=28 /DNA_END=3177 /DNA_ORIENTATION=-
MHVRSSPSRGVPDDLLHLEDLDESELLRCLKERYDARDIYTWVGSVLVSVNPYCDIGVFREELAALYSGTSQGSQPPPHLFAAVAAAFAAPGRQHALLISGESGAGKTEATRAALSFLAKRCGADESVKERLLHSNPVLEAFGNAQTRQNGNSSRFGKFIEVHLSRNGHIAGATLQPYMLEASRVTGQLPKAERTYHIFYLLRSALGSLSSGRDLNGIVWQTLASCPEWMTAVQSGGAVLANSSRLEGGPGEAECIAECEKLIERLFCTGMSNIEVAQCACVVAAVALLADEAAEFNELAVGLKDLLGVAPEDTESFFTRVETKVGNSGRERFLRERGFEESRTLRASIAQELYAALFAWLTRFIACGISPTGVAAEAGGGRRLGFLDLYGFEVFNSNGFEQFLINYCNERIQQLFNRQVFFSEAEEYAAEGLSSDGEWQRLKAACRLPALTLLEGEPGASTPVGIFGVINDRSRCGFEDGRSSDGRAVSEAIASMCGGHSAFRRSAGCAFTVAHFAGEVVYDATQFVRKNASAHRPDVIEFFRRSGGEFARGLFTPTDVVLGEESLGASSRACASGATAGRRRLIGSTLISSFRTELNELCATLESRECRHIRCLRPNDSQEPLHFDRASMLRQCNYSGLLEATRIRRFGYAHRRSLSTFGSRYEDLIPDAPQLQDGHGRYSTTLVAKRCAAICAIAEAAGVPADELCVGKTKVFLRAGGLAWLEERRRSIAKTRIVASLRRRTATWHVDRLRRSALTVQAHARGFLARLQARSRRKQLLQEAERASALEAAAALAAVTAAAQQHPGSASSAVRDVRGIPLSTQAGYCDRLPGLARRQLANKWGSALAMGALARSPARSPRGAPSLGTKRRNGAVRVPATADKENEEPAKNELVRNRSKCLPQKQIGSATASPQISPQIKNRRARQVKDQGARDLSSVNLGPRSIREPWSSRGLAAAAAEAAVIATSQQLGPSPRARSYSGNAPSSGRGAPLCSARSGSSKHAELRGPTSPRSACRDPSPRLSPPATPKLPFRAGIPSGKLFTTSARP